MAKNILLITIDSLRKDRLAFHGHSENHTPTINSLIEDGIAFEHGFATGPGTQPSFPALLTGTHLLSYQGIGKLSSERPSLAKNLKSIGFTTAGFQSNPFLSESFGYGKGFETYRDYQNPLMGLATTIFPRGIEMNNSKLEKLDEIFGLTDIIKRSYQLVSGKSRPYVGADIITNDTIEWLNNVDNQFFCWAHYMDVHHPCYPPKKYREQYGVGDVTNEEVSNWYSALINNPSRLDETEIDSLLALYDAAIKYVDDQIGRLVNRLEENNQYQDTLIIITSDHGEMFGEHGEHGKPPRMYDELLRVPLIVANGPEYLENGGEELVSLIDIPPLIHNVLGIDVPAEYEGQVPGQSERRSYIQAENEIEGQPIIGARSKDALYEYDATQNTGRVYEVRGDTAIPTEDLTPPPELQSVVLDRLEQIDGGDKFDLHSEVDDEIADRLEDLGYL